MRGALGAGAGAGRHSRWLADAGWDVTAVDVSQAALAKLDAAATRAGLTVHTVVGDMGDYLTRGERFDLVVLANIHPAAAEWSALFGAVATAVAPGRHLFFVGHHRDALGRAGPPDPARLYTEEQLGVVFPGLHVLNLERRESGRADDRAPLVDMVAWAARPARTGPGA